MRPVKHSSNKIQYLKKKFLKNIFKNCIKSRSTNRYSFCIPLFISINEPSDKYNWGFHHRLKDDKGNRYNYPDFIDCLFNLDYLPNCCHICSNYKLKHYTTYMANKRNNTLNKPKWICIKEYVNKGDDEWINLK